MPVIVLDHLTESQKRAYILADNQLALNAGWDTGGGKELNGTGAARGIKGTCGALINRV